MQRIRTLLLVLPALVLVPSPAHASSTSSMPWDNILSLLADSATGTVIRAVVTIAIVIGGIYWALSDNQHGLVRILKALVVAGIVTGIAGFLGAFGISFATL